MKIKFCDGSALLLVFIISFVLSLAALRCWRVSSLMCDIQYQRELFYKRFYLAQRILNSGIDLSCKNFDSFLKLKKTTSIDLNFCLTDDEIRNSNAARLAVSGFIKIVDCLVLSASLVQKNEVVCNLRCLLERKINAEKKKAEDKRIYFVVNNFTLGASL